MFESSIVTFSFLSILASVLITNLASTSSLVDTTFAIGAGNGSNEHTLNYLLFSSSTRQAHERKLEDLLKDSNHSHVSDSVNLQLATSVWKRMRQNALEFAQQRAEEAKPTINRLLQQANVSSSCRKSLNDVLNHISKLDSWAVESEYPMGFAEALKIQG